jgi:hypothetical protein
MLGVDYSSGRPDPAHIDRLGYGFVCRYLAPLANGKPSWKELRASERDAILKTGLPLVLFFESTAKRALEGKNAGRADGRTATQRADALKVPRGVCIYAAIDTDISKKDFAALDAYFDGFAATLRTDLSVGGYGEYDALDHLFAGKRIVHGFQTAAWSSNRVHPRAELYQHARSVTIDGVSCDVDELMHSSSFGGWFPNGVHMATLDREDLQAIREQVWTSDTLPAPDSAGSKKTNPTWSHDNGLRRCIDDLDAVKADIAAIKKALNVK